MNRFIIDGRYGSLISSVGLPLREILIKSGLPEDLFSRKNIRLTQDEYFRFMESIGEVMPDESKLIKIATAEGIVLFETLPNGRKQVSVMPVEQVSEEQA